MADNIYANLDNKRSIGRLVNKFHREILQINTPNTILDFDETIRAIETTIDEEKLETQHSFITYIRASDLQELFPDECGVCPNKGTAKFIKAVHEITKETTAHK